MWNINIDLEKEYIKNYHESIPSQEVRDYRHAYSFYIKAFIYNDWEMPNIPMLLALKGGGTEALDEALKKLKGRVPEEKYTEFLKIKNELITDLKLENNHIYDYEKVEKVLQSSPPKIKKERNISKNDIMFIVFIIVVIVLRIIGII